MDNIHTIKQTKETGMIEWIKSKLGIIDINKELMNIRHEIKDLENAILAESEAIERSLDQLKKFTKMDVDLNVVERDGNTVIFTGYYNNKQWVEFVDLSRADFNQAIDYIRSMKKHSDLRIVDAPINFDHSSVRI